MTTRARSLIGIALAGGLALAVYGRPVAEVSATVADVAGTLTGVSYPVSAQVEAGRHLGFDTHLYPGDDAMRAWKHTPYEWVGYYLHAPCHKDESWSGTRQTLTSMGWGIAVVYVGQQSWGNPRGSPKAVTAARRHGLTCFAGYVGADQGRVDADDAIARTAVEGFGRGAVIFLDVERMDQIPDAMLTYYRAWTARVLADGRFRPGAYVHTRNAAALFAEARELYDAAGVRDDPPFWVASTHDFSPNKNPTAVGHAFAAVWQGLLDVTQTWNGVKIPVDVSVSTSRSPSAADGAAGE